MISFVYTDYILLQPCRSEMIDIDRRDCHY